MFDVLRRHWLAVAASSELKKPIARTVLGVPLVLARTGGPDPGGRAFALADRCPHRSAPLSAGRVHEGRLRCPYHGWEFDADGVCAHAPGLARGALPIARAEAFATSERDGVVFVRLEGERPMPDARRDASAFDSFHLAREVRAELPDVLENLLDGTHTPWVHGGLLRSTSRQQRFHGTLRLGEVAEVVYEGEGGQAGWVSRLFERDRTVSIGRFVPPSTAEIEYRSARGTELLVVVRCTPIARDRVSALSTVHVRRTRVPLALKRAVLEPVLRVIGAQDRRILELQSANRARFGHPKHHVWRADLLRPAIDHWLAHERFPPGPADARVEFDL
jgi:phenylpropionate dioxygenase-like ring-hydroxylating dioxygenase large terminal subunit